MTVGMRCKYMTSYTTAVKPLLYVLDCQVVLGPEEILSFVKPAKAYLSCIPNWIASVWHAQCLLFEGLFMAPRFPDIKQTTFKRFQEG